jgi:hypothetical protein
LPPPIPAFLDFPLEAEQVPKQQDEAVESDGGTQQV